MNIAIYTANRDALKTLYNYYTQPLSISQTRDIASYPYGCILCNLWNNLHNVRPCEGCIYKLMGYSFIYTAPPCHIWSMDLFGEVVFSKLKSAIHKEHSTLSKATIRKLDARLIYLCLQISHCDRMIDMLRTQP